MTDRIGLYPGSFDPITNGHIDIIKRSLRVVDKLVIGIAVNVGKTGLFSLKEREKLVLSDIEKANKLQWSRVKPRKYYSKVSDDLTNNIQK